VRIPRPIFLSYAPEISVYICGKCNGYKEDGICSKCGDEWKDIDGICWGCKRAIKKGAERRAMRPSYLDLIEVHAADAIDRLIFDCLWENADPPADSDTNASASR
jgi:hypothetical protein